ncbi:MAG: ABC transporter ATP-binding protein/permease [Bacillota bacterium]|nr:ABC transporter ATP-binding protein/permease [Bacillota bacterium]
MKVPIKNYYKLLSKYLKPYRLKVAILSFSVLFNVLLLLVNPQIIRKFIDTITEKQDMSQLYKLAVIFFVFAVLQQLFVIFITYLSNSIGWSATNTLRKDLVQHCLNLDMSFHKRFKSGELIERVDGDVSLLLNFFSEFIIVVVNNVLLIIGVLILLFREDWRVGLTQSFFVVIAIFALYKFQDISVPHWKAVRETTSNFYGYLGESISSTEDIKANGAAPFAKKRFYEYIKKWFPRQYKAAKMSYSMVLVTLGLTALGNCLVLALGACLWNIGLITIGTIYLFFNYNSYIVFPLEEIRRQLQDLQTASAGIIRIEELFSIQSKITDGTGPTINEDSINLVVNNLTYGYEEDVPVLKNISFELPKGKILGVLGHTGSGKTTLARLIMRLYDTEDGDIYLNSRPIKSIPLKNLRDKVAYVTQDVQIFNGTIRDNITLFDESVSDNSILNIFNEMGMMDWYNSLNNGLDTLLSANGDGLSAGEAQLLALTRVFLKNPSLVILDEASSRLDAKTESIIQNAILKLIKGRSVIIIAHRLWTVNCADDILILDQGEILEHGNREDLIKDKSSKFNDLLKTGAQEVLA